MNSMDHLRHEAEVLDAADALRSFREEFHHPVLNGMPAIYLCGNSLGLQPKAARAAIGQELDDWATWAVEGHFHAKNPWFSYQDAFAAPLARIAGALPDEVTAMNALTVNLHLLMVSFYRPTQQRWRIICEAKAFPSDQYALESQVRFHGLDPKEAIVEVAPQPGRDTIDDADLLATIGKYADTTALVLLGGVNYYTGQVFDMGAVASACQRSGITFGLDLAHAIGNVPLELHAWGVDFACWCSYKYLNSGPGAVAGAFVHERHADRPDLPRFAGWWGNDPDTRFRMEPGFSPAHGARGWQMSNAPVLNMAAHMASLQLFDRAGMPALRAKSLKLTDLLHRAMAVADPKGRARIITPKEDSRRGSQVSMLIPGKAEAVHAALLQAGVIGDLRRPDVIRVSPVPLYNSFSDVVRFAEVLAGVLA